LVTNGVPAMRASISIAASAFFAARAPFFLYCAADRPGR